MQQRAWKISTFAGLGLAAFFALHPLGAKDPNGGAPTAGKAAGREPRGDGLFSWLGGGASSAKPNPAHTGTHLQQLRNARNPNEQCDALASLGLEATGDEEATDAIGEHAATTSPRAVRLCAVRALENVHSGASDSYLANLVEDSDRYVLDAALRALASRAADDSNARSTVIAAAHSSDADTRVEALIALGDAHLPEASSLLEDALATDSGENRLSLVAALGETHDASAVPVISTLIERGSRQTRAAAIEALGAIGGDGALTVLADVLASGSRDDVAAAAAALAKTGDPKAQQALVDAATGESPVKRVVAMRALATLEGDEVRTMMHDGLRSTDPRVVDTALSWYTSHADKSSVPELASMLKSAPSQSRDSLLSALATVGGDEARDAIASVARSGAAMDRGVALSHLANMPGGRDDARRIAIEMTKAGGQDLPQALTVLAQDTSTEARDAIVSLARGGGISAGEAMHALAQRGDKEAVGELRDLARTAKTPQLRAQAISSLAASPDPQTTPLLLSAANDKDPTIRRAAMVGLARSGADGAERALVTGASDSDSSTRAMAIRGLGMLRTQTAIGELERIASGNGDEAADAFQTLASTVPDRAAAIADRAMASGSPDARRTILSSASSLPAADAQRILSSALQDPDENVATAAVNHLSEVGGTAAEQSLLDVLTSKAPDTVKHAAADALSGSGSALAEQHSGLIETWKSSDSDESSSDVKDGPDDGADEEDLD